MAAVSCLQGTDERRETTLDDSPANEPASHAQRPYVLAAGSPGSEDETAQAWFVELSSPPASQGGDRIALRLEKDTFRNEARRVGLTFTERAAFDDLWNGLSVQIDPDDRAKLARIRGVKRIFPVVPVHTDLSTATVMSGAAAVHNAAPYYKGEGIKVGVIDSGIDYHHKDLGSCFGPGCKVAYGYDFVGDAFAAGVAPPIPDNDPDDCGGHGTHVAGIIGADRVVHGAAPKVTFGAYRVFGCSGSTTADIMVKAMERAKQDGMQVVNMSIGSAFAGWKEYPSAVAADNLVSSGVVVVCSAGNSGTSGLYASGAPGLGEKVISVAMFDNTHASLAAATLGDMSSVGYTGATGAPAAPKSGTANLAKRGTPTSTDDACNTNLPPPQSYAGKVALIRRGGCPFYEKSKNAEAAGAIGVVLYNNVAGRVSPTVAGTPAVTIPVIAVSDVEGATMNNLIDAGKGTITWTDGLGKFPNPTANLLNDGSSYGLAATLDMKPDIGAPGGLIYSTYPLELGGYATLNGMSMASPHTAGAAALFLQAHPGATPEDVRTALLNTAQPKLWSLDPAKGSTEMVHRQGAGMVAIDKAIAAPARVTPSKLPLGETEGASIVRKLTVQNLSASPITYTLSHNAAVSTSGGTTNAPVNSDQFASTVVFSEPSVTVPAGGTAGFDATITPHANLAQRGIFGGYIVLTAGDGGVLRVPYVGLNGDYQSIKVITPTDKNFPWIATSGKDSSGNDVYYRAQSGASFTMANGDIPYIVMHFEHQARLLRVTATSRNGTFWGETYREEFLARSSTATASTAFAWDGTAVLNNQTVTVPNGQYSLRVEVLKPLGDEANPAHWETWTSGTVVINR